MSGYAKPKPTAKAAWWSQVGLCILVVSLAACSPHMARQNVDSLSPEPGQPQSARTGTPLLVSEKGSIEKAQRWVGLMNSPDGYETMHSDYSPDFLRREIVYQGISGTVIRLVYREFVAGSVMPSREEPYTFDLSRSDDIRIQGFHIKVQQADAAAIHYILLPQ